MKLADILALHPTATIEAKVAASFYDGTIDYDVPRDTLAIPGWACPDTEGATGRYGDDIDAVIRDYVTPDTLRALNFEDRSNDDMSFDGAGYYYAGLAGETAPDEKYGERLPLAISVYVVIPDDRDPDPDELNGWCASIINRAPDSSLAADARAWLDGTAADGGPELDRLVADWRANN